MVSFALIGAGRIGRLHAGNLAANPRVRFTAVADVAAAAAEQVAAAHGARAVSVEAAITGPSAIGSEKGMPSSIRGHPAAASSPMAWAVTSSDG